MQNDGESSGWELRALDDLASGPLVYCFPGFMGAVCERLVEQGLADRECLGEMPAPQFWPDTPKGRREWRARMKADPAIQFRYMLTHAGWAAIEVI